ncbi:MAG TPA: hypothetical protein VIO14_06980 [Dehalococcoidia bacterium]
MELLAHAGFVLITQVEPGPWGPVIQVFNNIETVLRFLMVGIVTVALLVAMVVLVTSGGNPHKQAQAWSAIQVAVLGFVGFLLVPTIVDILRWIVGA